MKKGAERPLTLEAPRAVRRLSYLLAALRQSRAWREKGDFARDLSFALGDPHFASCDLPRLFRLGQSVALMRQASAKRVEMFEVVFHFAAFLSSLTPAPPPFSAMNSTPADSRARAIAWSVAELGSLLPLSKAEIVLR
jgi:hypothetical protein